MHGRIKVLNSALLWLHQKRTRESWNVSYLRQHAHITCSFACVYVFGLHQTAYEFYHGKRSVDIGGSLIAQLQELAYSLPPRFSHLSAFTVCTLHIVCCHAIGYDSAVDTTQHLLQPSSGVNKFWNVCFPGTSS
jgi:hypothetical protein